MTWPLAVATGGYVDRPIVDVLAAVHEAGITTVELGTPPRHFAPWDRSQIDAVAAELGRTALHPLSIHAPFGGPLDLADANPRHRQAAIAAILTAAGALKRLGGRIVVVHPSDTVRHAHEVDGRLRGCIEALQGLAGAIDGLDMRLALETPLPHLVGGSPEEFVRILAALPESVGVCLDTGHAHLGHHWHRFIEAVGHRLVHVHATDHHGRFDDHLPPGDGVLDWADIGRTLRGVGYTGCIVLEVAAGREPMPEYFRRARRQAQALLDG
ncbi:MAG: sugar phosphate isomerase/epimerase family protein [Acidobacteriota bacterium]